MYKLQIYDDIYGHPGRLITEEQYIFLSAKDKCLFTPVIEAEYNEDEDNLPSILEMDSELCVDSVFDDGFFDDDYGDDFENDFA